MSFALRGDMDNSGLRCVCVRGTPLGVLAAGRISLTLIGCRACVGGSAGCADWPCLDCAVDLVWIGYIRPGLEDGLLIDVALVTGSLVSSTLFSRRDVYCTAGFSSIWTFCGTDCVLLAGCQVFLRRIIGHWAMAANSASVVEDRAGITFGVELYVPWHAPEVVVDILSACVVPLRHIPDVIGLVGHREGVVESRVLQGREARSVRVLVLDCRGVDQNFHDVMIVDKGDVPESHVSLPELSALIQQRPPAVINHMGWRQLELEEMHVAAKQRFRQSRQSCCTFYRILIKCDMYRHVARFHLDLAKLWRCPVSWCTVWKGTPQDCVDHIHGAHDVPWEIKSASLEKYLPPWTVTRQVWSDSLTSQHSASRLMCCYSATLACRLSITTGSTSEVSHTLLFVGTTCHSCTLCCRCWRSCRPWGCRPTPPARVRCVRRDPRTPWLVRLGRPDAQSGAGDQSGSWSHPCRTFQASRFRILWRRRRGHSSIGGLNRVYNVCSIGGLNEI